MSRKAKFNLISADGKAIKTILGEFEDGEWDDLQRFMNYADDLSKIELFKKGGPGQLTLRYERDKGFSYSTTLPPDDQILSLMHRLRPFVLQKESTNFYKVCKHLKRRLEHNEVRDFLDALRKYFSGQRMQQSLIIQSKNITINSESTLRKWLNAHEYHKDSDKQKELEDLHQILPLEASRAIFIMMLFDMAKSVLVLGSFIGVLTGRQKQFSCTIQ